MKNTDFNFELGALISSESSLRALLELVDDMELEVKGVISVA